MKPGDSLGSYRVLEKVGEGGMGEVYRAHDSRLHRDVAIKILPETVGSDPERLARFEREARAVAALSHPGILAIHDFGTDGRVTYAVTELLDGATLRARLDAGPIPSRKAIDIGAQIASAVGAAHDKGIVHRDIKPENIVITNDGRVKVLDFGLAKALGPAGTSATADAAPGATVTNVQTDAGIVLGTVGYMSPEQVRALPADHRSDIFSIGVVLYEMLTGRRPFGGASTVETMNAILKEDPAPLTAADAVAPALRHIVDHCLEKEPAERFQSARDLAFALQQLSPASAPSGAIAAIDTAPRRRLRFLWQAAAFAALLAAVFGAGWMMAPRDVPASFAFRRLTYRPGNLLRARFSPDGKTVVYSASWEGRPAAVYTMRTDGGDSRELLGDASVAAVSSGGELAVVRLTASAAGALGTLARLPLGGGAPRDVLQDVFAADWGPTADDLAVVRRAPSGFQRLESPVGRVLHEAQSIQSPRISPEGKHLAYLADGKLIVVERATGTTVLRGPWAVTNSAGSLAWAPSGGEIFVQAGPHPDEVSLRAVDLSGRDRIVVAPAGGLFALHDVSATGEMLIERAAARGGVAFRGAGDQAERDLSWLDGSTVRQLSHDGAWMLFSESLQARGKLGDVFIRRTDGSPAIRLGDGNPLALSRDGKWVLARTTQNPSRLVLMPTGAGSAKVLDTGAFEPNGGTFAPDGSVIFGSVPSPGRIEFHRLDLQTGAVRPLKVEGDEGSAFVIDRSVAIGPDGFARVLPDGHVEIVRNDGSRRMVPGAALEADDDLEFLNAAYLYVARRTRVAAELSRIDLRTGARTPWRTLSPADPAGLIAIGTIAIAGDGESYAYSYRRVTSSDLYLARATRVK
jgi:dipeptidyl aminopeptidase/acylaminoacyl peptidase